MPRVTGALAKLLKKTEAFQKLYVREPPSILKRSGKRSTSQTDELAAVAWLTKNDNFGYRQ